jgi:hypothetical protein
MEVSLFFLVWRIFGPPWAELPRLARRRPLLMREQLISESWLEFNVNLDHKNKHDRYWHCCVYRIVPRAFQKCNEGRSPNVTISCFLTRVMEITPPTVINLTSGGVKRFYFLYLAMNWLIQLVFTACTQAAQLAPFE